MITAEQAGKMPGLEFLNSLLPVVFVVFAAVAILGLAIGFGHFVTRPIEQEGRYQEKQLHIATLVFIGFLLAVAIAFYFLITL